MTTTLAPCGTWAGYHTHRRRGQVACEPCRLAANAYRRARKKQQRAEDPFAVVERRIKDYQARWARKMLAHAHPEEYRDLMRQILDVPGGSRTIPARAALAKAHPEEYQDLLRQARELFPTRAAAADLVLSRLPGDHVRISVPERIRRVARRLLVTEEPYRYHELVVEEQAKEPLLDKYARARSRQRAETRLAREFPETFNRLLDELNGAS